MPTATIKVAYVNAKDRGPSNIKDETGRQYKVWKDSKYPGVPVLGDFTKGQTYDIEWADDGEYNGKPQYKVTKILSSSSTQNGGGNGSHGVPDSPHGHAADRSYRNPPTLEEQARISRAHAQEMALIYGNILYTATKAMPSFEDIQELTDRFQLDNDRSPKPYDPVEDAKKVFRASEIKDKGLHGGVEA